MLKVNMQSFRKGWRDYSDNIRYGESIRASKGSVLSLDYQGYKAWLDEFHIFYTCPMAD